MEVEATDPKTFGETAERVHAVGLQEEALRLIPHPPEASSWDIGVRGEVKHCCHDTVRKMGEG